MHAVPVKKRGITNKAPKIAKTTPATKNVAATKKAQKLHGNPGKHGAGY